MLFLRLLPHSHCFLHSAQHQVVGPDYPRKWTESSCLAAKTGTVTLNGPIHGICLQRALLPSGKVHVLPHVGPKETQGGGQKEPKSPHGQPIG